MILGAVYIWAPVCSSLLTSQNGSLVHMKCFYTAQASAGLTVLLMISAAAAYFCSKEHHKVQWIIIAITALLIANTYSSALGIGMCKNPMECHVTAVWIRGGALLAGAMAIFDVYSSSTRIKAGTPREIEAPTD